MATQAWSASTAIGADALKPESLEDMLGLKYEEVLYDPTQDKKLTKEELGRKLHLHIAYNAGADEVEPYSAGDEPLSSDTA